MLVALVAIPATASAKSNAGNGAPAVKAHVSKAKKALVQCPGFSW